VDLITEKKNFSHGNQLFEFFPRSYPLLEKNKKLLNNLGYLFIFLQKWIATREKFEKLISVGAFFFFSISRRLDPRSRMSRKQNKTKNLMADLHAKVSGLSFASSSHNLKKTF
jgi:hypothetical protein